MFPVFPKNCKQTVFWGGAVGTGSFLWPLGADLLR